MALSDQSDSAAAKMDYLSLAEAALKRADERAAHPTTATATRSIRDAVDWILAYLREQAAFDDQENRDG